jgi:predicted nucleic acid-binding protein
VILVDASVLIDIVVATSEWTGWSQGQLAAASADGIAINFVIYAEIAPCFARKTDLDGFLHDFAIHLLPITDDAAYLASTAHQAYRDAGGQRAAALPDFFIGAHASVAGLDLLTRDPKRIRTYFPQVTLITAAVPDH